MDGEAKFNLWLTIIITAILIFSLLCVNHADKQAIANKLGVSTTEITRIIFSWEGKDTRVYEVRGKRYIASGVFNIDVWQNQ